MILMVKTKAFVRDKAAKKKKHQQKVDIFRDISVRRQIFVHF